MYCTRKITDDLIHVGANDRRLWMFEGQYAVPDGMSYHSYLLLDEKTVLFDTVDKAVSRVFFENVAHALGGRPLDYLIVQHMEPDHSATITELLLRYPDTVIVCNAKTKAMLGQFYGLNAPDRLYVVSEGDELITGRHTLSFLMAPMVHWPEVMVTYDRTDRVLFSADAFGTFGALNGALFADEVNFMRDHLDEARRYYCNIVGKYGNQVQALLKKTRALDIRILCPLHGFIWRKNLGEYLEYYRKWSAYEPEEQGVMIAYASVYGNTENTAEILSGKLREMGVATAMFDVSVKPSADIIAAAFRYSHLVFASTTYNAGIFSRMEDTLIDLAGHNMQNRTVALIENGSWAATSGKLMKDILLGCKDMRILEETVTIKSALHETQLGEVDALAQAIRQSMTAPAEPAAAQDPKALFALSYGLFVVTARDGNRDNGCITNTVQQIASQPNRISLSVNKANLTHDMILKTGEFNASVLSEEATFDVFTRFGFQSGRDADKFAGYSNAARSENGLYYLTSQANALFSAKVVQSIDCGSHTLFLADITASRVLSDAPSATYAYYFAHIKPGPKPAEKKVKGWVCGICGYVYEGETLPEDFVCPLCKHGAENFEPLP